MGGSNRPGSGMAMAFAILTAGFWYFTGVLGWINSVTDSALLLFLPIFIPMLLITKPMYRLFDKLEDRFGYTKASIIDNGCFITAAVLFVYVGYNLLKNKH